jgi:hypothetical protein
MQPYYACRLLPDMLSAERVVRRRRLVPHFHPGASEYFLGIKGKINLVVYVNKQLVRRAVP